MPVVVFDYQAAQAGVVTLVNYDATSEVLDLPDGVFPIDERPSFAESTRSESRLYVAGGLNENCMVTEDSVMLRQYIAPISMPMVLDPTPADYQIGLEIVAGTGLIGDAIFFLRWYDKRNNRRSPLSAGSPTLTLSGAQSVKIYNMPDAPDPTDDGVGHFEVWVNLDGELDPTTGQSVIRRLARRTVGAGDYTIYEDIEYEAELEEGLSRLPRVRYNAIYHSRLWSAGDVAHPERIYYSPLERYSEFTTDSYLETLNGEPVKGLVKVRNVLVVLCPHSSYYIMGYSENDFEVNSLEPDIGCITHHGIKMIHDIAIIPSHQGLYACSGTSMRLLDGDYSTTWTEKYNANRLGFENGFGITDTRAKVYKFFEEDVTVESGVPTYGAGRFWVFDYKNFSEQEGGGYAAPYLSFDRYALRARAAAMVAPPGSASANCFQAFTGGAPPASQLILQENDWAAGDLTGTMTLRLQTAPIVSEPMGGPNDGLLFIDGWMYVWFKTLAESWSIYAMRGPDRAMIQDAYSWIVPAVIGMPQASVSEAMQLNSMWSNWAAWYEISSITRVGSTATATTVYPHNLSTGDTRTVSGADQIEYNGAFVITVTGANTFTYTVGGAPVTPATTATTLQVTGAVNTFSPEALPFKINLTGEGLSLLLEATNPIGLVWAGFGFTSEAGKKYLSTHV